MSLASRKLIQATAGAAGEAADTGDDDFANVVLLLDGDGTSGDDNNTFTDSSTNGFTVTESGSVVQGSFSPYGDNWSNYFDSSSSLSVTNLTAPGTTFTVEFWVYFNDPNDDGLFQFTDTLGAASTTDRPGLFVDSAGQLKAYANGGNRGTGTTLESGQWYHIAMVRASSTVNVYVDGTSVWNAAETEDFSAHNDLNIGKLYSAGYLLNGYLSNFRYVSGTAVYTANFTPPTAPLTAITNTELLTCQSNRFIDNSSNSYTVAIQTGTPKVTPFSPFKNDDARDITTDGGSGYFDGSSYLSTPNDTAYRPNTGAYTVEGWFYITKNTTQVLFDARQTGNTDQRVTFWVTNGDDLNYWHGTGTSTSSNVFNMGEWVYIAASRGSGTTEIYVNGTRTKSFSDSTQLYNFRPYYGARWDAGAKLDEGYLADWRITVGEKLYTGATMTVPTAPIGLHSSTDSYLAFQDAGIYDRTGINNLDTVGTAQIDTAVTKYGTGSIEFDGNSDYLLGAENQANTLAISGAFTAECWFYQTATAGTGTALHALISQWNNATNNKAFVMGISSTSMVLYVSNDGTNNAISGATGGTVSNNTWNHAALTWDGTNYRVFLNGTAVITQANSSPPYSSNEVIQIGTSKAGSGGALVMFYQGYMDDIRITNGVARYTSSFTPPTAALPKF